jgi:AraC family transcriptional regulator of adaptative response/methylated-DNA-[protein]-cysteine methyltransferase
LPNSAYSSEIDACFQAAPRLRRFYTGVMSCTAPPQATLYQALLARDSAYDGHAYVGVTTTGIFCRLTCPARKPKLENTQFFATIAECLNAGFRPCLRCRPLERAGAREPIVATLMARLDADPEHDWSTTDLTAQGFDPSTVRRAFKRHFGMTFLDLARMRRTGRGLDRLAQGGPVIEAQLDAGYASGSGFREAVTRLIGDCPASLKGNATLKADWLETPIGAMLAVADATTLHLLEFFDRKALPAELARLRSTTGAAIGFGRLPPIDQVASELQAYFAGHTIHFTTKLTRHGTAFTRRTWEILQTIPPGKTWSYAQVAAALGQPTAVRAVARANAANQIAILIPCHRVIGADGALTGYGGGLWRKRWLIEHERRHASPV